MLPARYRMLIPRCMQFGCSMLLVLLTACSSTSTIVLGGSYPTPLARRLPLTLGVYYPPELRNYSYQEPDDTEGNDKYVVQSGATHLQLFNTMLPALFNKVVLLDSPEQALSNGNIDVVLIPAIAEFQLSLPQKTHLKVYEVWMRYNLKLGKANGEPIAQWMMTAYGKAPQEDMQSVDSGIRSAARVALRDLEASFTLGFAEVPEIKDWLGANNRDKR